MLTAFGWLVDLPHYGCRRIASLLVTQDLVEARNWVVGIVPVATVQRCRNDRIELSGRGPASDVICGSLQGGGTVAYRGRSGGYHNGRPPPHATKSGPLPREDVDCVPHRGSKSVQHHSLIYADTKELAEKEARDLFQVVTDRDRRQVYVREKP